MFVVQLMEKQRVYFKIISNFVLNIVFKYGNGKYKKYIV